jgi:hypothetical protein
MGNETTILDKAFKALEAGTKETTTVVTNTPEPVAAEQQMMNTAKNTVITPPTGNMNVSGFAAGSVGGTTTTDRPEPPPADNNHVADGCEAFSGTPPRADVPISLDVQPMQFGYAAPYIPEPQPCVPRSVLEAHEIIDKWFEENFSVKQITGEREDAKVYERQRVAAAVSNLKGRLGI